MVACPCLLVSREASFHALLRALLAEEVPAFIQSDGAELHVLIRELQPVVLALDLTVRDHHVRWPQLLALPEAQPVVICAASGWLLEGHSEVLARPNVAVWTEPFDPGDLVERVRGAMLAALGPNG